MCAYVWDGMMLCETWTRKCLFVSWTGRFMVGGEHVII